MKIAFYVGTIEPETVGGGSTFQLNFIEALLEYQTNNNVIVYYVCENDIYENTENIQFKNLYEKFYPKKEHVFDSRKKKRLTLNQIVKQDNIEVIYFINLQTQLVDIPYFTTVWDLAHKEHPYFPESSVAGFTFEARESYYNKVLPRASGIIIGNLTGKKQLLDYYPLNEKLIHTNPLPTPEYVYKLPADDSILEKLKIQPKKYLFYPAQFWPHKNHIRLLKEFKNNHFDLKLVFSGADKGNMTYIKQKVEEYNLNDYVIFAGFIKKEEIISLYKNAYALCYASYFDPDNLPPLEAMALNCPVICSDTKGMKEQLKDCALFFNNKTGENLVENINKLSNEEFRNEITQKAQNLALSYSTKNYIKKVFELLDDFSLIRECWSNKEEFIHL